MKTAHTHTPDLLRALRNWHPTHSEAMQFFVGVSSAIKHGQNALGEKCRDSVVDDCDTALGTVEQDQIDQQNEAAWAAQQQRKSA